MEKGAGRIMRNMSFSGMASASLGGWQPVADLYETSEQLILHMDVAGVDPEKLTVSATLLELTIAGERQCPVEDVCRVHRLEIDHGAFERTIALPLPVEVGRIASCCKNGFLVVTMPKKDVRDKIQVKVEQNGQGGRR